MIESNLA